MPRPQAAKALEPEPVYRPIRLMSRAGPKWYGLEERPRVTRGRALATDAGAPTPPAKPSPTNTLRTPPNTDKPASRDAKAKPSTADKPSGAKDFAP